MSAVPGHNLRESRRACCAAGFLFVVCLFFHCGVLASADAGEPDLAQACLTGFPPVVADGSALSGYSVEKPESDTRVTVHPNVSQWFRRSGWSSGYAAWQQSRYCQSDFLRSLIPLSRQVCDSPEIATPNAAACADPQDSYNLLAMHRHMLQSIRSLWPHIEEPFSGWQRFPRAVEDFPPEVRDQFVAWPNAVLRSAHLADMLPKKSYQEVVERWPTEADFAHWLVCGSERGDKGMTADALYGALLHNVQAGADLTDPAGQALESYGFWMAQGWFERVWNKYRMVIGRMPSEPKLQANLIRQCRVLHRWSEVALTNPVRNNDRRDSGTLYVNGNLNPGYLNKSIRVLGEVVDIRLASNGKPFFRLDPKLMGVAPIWMTARAHVNETAIQLRDRYLFVGRVRPLEDELQSELKAPAVLLVESFQSPK